MKRRNADTGKLRRPIKRTKITEGMYGNSMLYVKFVLLWSSVALADYMLEFRFEFLWPLWLMMKGIYHCYHCRGLTFTLLFTCVALTSDMICYYFIPIQMLTYLAGVYVWVNSIWNTFSSKGVCAQTVGMWAAVMYAEGARAGAGVAGARGGRARPWAAGALAYPIVTLGVSVKQLVEEKLMLRSQRRLRAQDEFYCRLMRDALPEGGLTSSYSSELLEELDGVAEVKQNGGARRRWRPDTNGHCVRDREHASLHAKLEHLEQYIERKGRDSSSQSTQSRRSSNSVHSQSSAGHSSVSQSSVSQSTVSQSSAGHSSPHSSQNGLAKGPNTNNHCKGGSKSTKYDKKEATSSREERRRRKNRDVDKETIDSCKNKEQKKEQVDKEIESTKECAKTECNNIHKEEEKRRDEERKREKEEERKREEDRKREKEEERKREEERRKEKEREKELKEREKEKEIERVRELSLARECQEEVSRLRATLAQAQRSGAERARQLATSRAAHAELQQQLQHKMSTWRCAERAALERKLGDERRLRLAAEQLHHTRRAHGECENDRCKSRASAAESEASALKKELQRARERLAHALRDLGHSKEQVTALESEKNVSTNNTGASNGAAWAALRARAAHLERVLSAETRLKLDLLAALGAANRKVHVQENVINRQEKELEELKAQMLAVMPAEYVSLSPGSVSKMRLSGNSPLDPNATVYTPKQLCSDA